MMFSIRSMAAAICMAAILAVGISTSTPAHAGGGGGAAAGGFIAGLVIGGALNPNRPPTYSPVPTYTYQQPRCYWQSERFYDPYRGWLTRRVQVCN